MDNLELKKIDEQLAKVDAEIEKNKKLLADNDLKEKQIGIQLQKEKSFEKQAKLLEELSKTANYSLDLLQKQSMLFKEQIKLSEMKFDSNK